jgi:hypothetical protein
MHKLVAVLVCSATLGLAQSYKLEPVSTAAPDLPAAYSAVVSAQGYRIIGPSGPWCEIWFRKSIPTGAKPSEPDITLPIAQGTFLGILRFPGKGADRRGQVMKPGLYTMRYSVYPADGAHQGVSPQRDFALATPVANDPDPASMPDFNKLVAMSMLSGTPHCAVFSIEPPAGNKFPELTKEGESDTVLNVKVGDLPIAIILAGTAAQ